MAQINYLGRWVDRDSFRAFVYSATEEKLAKSYDEFEALIASGLWFARKEDVNVQIPVEKVKVEEKAQEIAPVVAEVAPITVEKPVDELKKKREKSKNEFRAATSLGK